MLFPDQEFQALDEGEDYRDYLDVEAFEGGEGHVPLRVVSFDISPDELEDGDEAGRPGHGMLPLVFPSDDDDFEEMLVVHLPADGADAPLINWDSAKDRFRVVYPGFVPYLRSYVLRGGFWWEDGNAYQTTPFSPEELVRLCADLLAF